MKKLKLNRALVKLKLNLALQPKKETSDDRALRLKNKRIRRQRQEHWIRTISLLKQHHEFAGYLPDSLEDRVELASASVAMFNLICSRIGWVKNLKAWHRRATKHLQGKIMVDWLISNFCQPDGSISHRILWIKTRRNVYKKVVLMQKHFRNVSQCRKCRLQLLTMLIDKLEEENHRRFVRASQDEVLRWETQQRKKGIKIIPTIKVKVEESHMQIAKQNVVDTILKKKREKDIARGGNQEPENGDPSRLSAAKKFAHLVSGKMKEDKAALAANSRRTGSESVYRKKKKRLVEETFRRCQREFQERASTAVMRLVMKRKGMKTFTVEDMKSILTNERRFSSLMGTSETEQKKGWPLFLLLTNVDHEAIVNILEKHFVSKERSCDERRDAELPENATRKASIQASRKASIQASQRKASLERKSSITNRRSSRLRKVSQTSQTHPPFHVPGRHLEL